MTEEKPQDAKKLVKGSAEDGAQAGEVQNKANVGQKSDEKPTKELSDEEKLAAKSLTVLTTEEHQKKYPPNAFFEIKNTEERTQSINLCNGRDEKMWIRDKNGDKQVNPDIPEACRTCPGRDVHINGLGRELVSLHMASCLESSQSKALLNQRVIRIKEVEKDGKLKRIVKNF